jgi:hypothetical protein
MSIIGIIKIHEEDIFYVLNCPLNIDNVIGVKTDYKHGTTMYHDQ